MPNDFDHLDHVTNSLIDAGIAKKISSQIYRHRFSDRSTMRWDIDEMKYHISQIQKSHRCVVSISPASVIEMVNSIESMKHIDKHYAQTLPEEKARLPIYIVEVTAPDKTRCNIVVDGNHRLYRAFLDRRGIGAILIPAEIESACRLPDPFGSQAP